MGRAESGACQLTLAVMLKPSMTKKWRRFVGASATRAGTYKQVTYMRSIYYLYQTLVSELTYMYYVANGTLNSIHKRLQIAPTMAVCSLAAYRGSTVR